jgi:hypothetical protein
MTQRPRYALPAKQTTAYSALEAAGWLEKDFVGWAHAYETWEARTQAARLDRFTYPSYLS